MKKNRAQDGNMNSKLVFKEKYNFIDNCIKHNINVAKNWRLLKQKKGIFLSSSQIRNNSNGEYIEEKTQCSWGFVHPITKIIYIGNKNNEMCWKLNSDHRYGVHSWGGSTPYGTHSFGAVSGKPREPAQEMDTIYGIIQMLNNTLL